MSSIYTNTHGRHQASVQMDHPVFRGFEAIGIKSSDLARMVGQPRQTLLDWRTGNPRMPDEWLVFLTKLLARLVEAMDQAPAPLGPDDDGIALARNWLSLAEEALKDLPREAYEKATRIANE